jgi:hypothetical protein
MQTTALSYGPLLHQIVALHASSSLAGGVSVVNGCVYMGEGVTVVSVTVVPYPSVGGSRVDAFCL